MRSPIAFLIYEYNSWEFIYRHVIYLLSINSSTKREGKSFFFFFQVGSLFLDQSKHECKDPNGFIKDMDSIVASAISDQLSLSRIDVADLLSKVFNVLHKHRVKLDPNFASVVLAIMVLEGLGRSLDPDLDILWKATPYLVKEKMNL